MFKAVLTSSDSCPFDSLRLVEPEPLRIFPVALVYDENYHKTINSPTIKTTIMLNWAGGGDELIKPAIDSDLVKVLALHQISITVMLTYIHYLIK
jgi:hypothetical protein